MPGGTEKVEWLCLLGVMSYKLLICVVIRVDLIATEENIIHIDIALQVPLVLLYSSGRLLILI